MDLSKNETIANEETPRGTKKRQSSTVVKLDDSHVQEAYRRHKEDLIFGLDTIQLQSRICSDEMLAAVVSSYMPSTLLSGAINCMRVDSLTQVMAAFQQLNLRVLSSAKERRRLNHMEQKQGLLHVLLEVVLPRGNGTARHINQLLLSFLLALGFRARLVGALAPRSRNPRLHRDIIKKQRLAQLNTSSKSKKHKKITVNDDNSSSESETASDIDETDNEEVVTSWWLEVFLATNSLPSNGLSHSAEGRWVHVNFIQRLVDSPLAEETSVGRRRTYALAVDSNGRASDVTARYTTQYDLLCAKDRLMGSDSCWWQQQLELSWVKAERTGIITTEKEMLERVIEREELELAVRLQSLPPTSVEAFRSHPVYVLERFLRWNEVLITNESSLPSSSSLTNSSSIAHSVFKGERVYLRSQIEQLLVRKDWRKQYRRVCIDQRGTPAKIVRRFLPAHLSTSGEAGYREVCLYRLAQTEPVPRLSVGSDGSLPVNEHGNIEVWDGDLRLVPVGAALVGTNSDAVRLAQQLGILCAPALVGFDLRGDKKVPRIGGAVVAEAQADLLREAVNNMMDHKEQQKDLKRQQAIVVKWERLARALLIRQSLKEKYGH